MKSSRPVYLNLWRIKLPLPGIVSILHRISGVVIFLGLPLLLYLLSQSLVSQDSFDHLSLFLAKPIIRFAVWILLAAVTCHFLAGIRHLLMDFGVGESLRGGRIGAYVVVILMALMVILLGIWIWS